MRWMVVVVAAAICGSGCGGSALRTVNRVTLAASTAMLACDWGQTHRAATTDWASASRSGWVLYEANPVLGENPSPSKIGGYFAAAAGANAALWKVLPEAARSIVPVALIAAQSMSVQLNHGSGLGLCGVR